MYQRRRLPQLQVKRDVQRIRLRGNVYILSYRPMTTPGRGQPYALNKVFYVGLVNGEERFGILTELPQANAQGLKVRLLWGHVPIGDHHMWLWQYY